METYAQNISIITDDMVVSRKNDILKWGTTGARVLNLENSKLAAYIREKCETKYEGDWTVIVGKGYGFSIRNAINHYLYFQFDDKYFTVFKH